MTFVVVALAAGTVFVWWCAAPLVRVPSPTASLVSPSLGIGAAATAGWCGLVLLALAAGPTVALVALGGGAIVRRRRSHQRRAARRRELDASMPIVASLFAVALQSGRSVASATEVIGPLVPGPAGVALRSFTSRQRVHIDTAQCLDELEVDLGPGGAEFVETLRSSVVDGAAVADALHALGDEHRRRRRRSLEASLRRLPVMLLLPLVACVLPAFMVLTVVPPVVESVIDLLP